jgi:phosphoribosylformylglycinamidine (FGAM) synthase-like enzyme
VTEQYDRYVLGGTVLAMPHDAGMVRLSDESRRGIALALDGNGRYSALDPAVGAVLALCEAYRNVAASGARPLAVTDCLNFGSPEDPEVMWQFAEAVRALAAACHDLGVPVTGGNVSFYNQTGATAIHPTPVLGVLGVIADVDRRLPSGFSAPRQTIALVGETAEELGGSAWAWVVHRHLGGRPPRARLAAERSLAGLLESLAADGVVTAAHDLSDGGLAQALIEATLLHGIGATLSVDDVHPDPFVALFSESAGRVLLSLPEQRADDLLARAAAARLPVAILGTTGGEALTVSGQFDLPLTDLHVAFEGTLPALFG